MMTIDFDKLRIILMPHALRHGALQEALLTSMYVPLKRNYAALRRYVEKEETERQYGPTVGQLRQAVADHLAIDKGLVRFGEVADRETIDLPRASDGWGKAVKLGADPVPLWADDMVCWNREFTVSLPATYSNNEAEVRALLDRWKMAASHYTITYYTEI
ncbi:MAG: hypothetical protein J6I49_03610 [Bacteroidales bacterium]|nr:hypothetical protein [Bacteroidales bacterium]